MNSSLADQSESAQVQSGTSALPVWRAALPRSWRILKPGRNCWRVAQTQRVAVLIDGGPYFARLEAALRLATREILIVGWDFDGAVRLRPDASPEDSKPLGELLHELVESRPDLEVHILVWSVAVAHAPSNPMPLLFGANWQKHPRIRVKLDTNHPIYAAHHQKIVCIDDAIAFVGGMDLTVDHWDTNRHLADDPLRVSPTGAPYRPVCTISRCWSMATLRAPSPRSRESAGRMPPVRRWWKPAATRTLGRPAFSSISSKRQSQSRGRHLT